MVSIRDWYANESARERGGFGYDWQNDDPVDRTPDSWLDEVSARSTRSGPVATVRTGGVRGSTRPSSAPWPSAATGTRSKSPAVPRQARLVADIHRIRSSNRKIGVTKLVAKLRAKGWTEVTEDQVRAVVVPPQRQAPADTSRIGPRATLDVVQRPRAASCPSCGGVISVLGICRCS